MKEPRAVDDLESNGRALTNLDDPDKKPAAEGKTDRRTDLRMHVNS